MQYLLIFVGGGAGSVLRFTIGLFFRKYHLAAPISTLASNVLACIIFGLVVAITAKSKGTGSIQLLLLTGFCGGLSTFSTFSAETFELLKSGQPVWATVNILVSVSLCLLMFRMILR